MKTTFFYKNMAKEEEGFFLEYVTKKLPAIENLLSTFSPDSLLLKLSIEKFNKHDAFEVEFALSVGNKELIACEASHQIEKATDQCKDRLLTQIKKHMALLRDDRDHGSIRETTLAELSVKGFEPIVIE